MKVKLTKKAPGRIDAPVHVDDCEAIDYMRCADGKLAPIHPTEGREFGQNESVTTPSGLRFFPKRSYGAAKSFRLLLQTADMVMDETVSEADGAPAAGNGGPTVHLAKNASAKRIAALASQGLTVICDL